MLDWLKRLTGTKSLTTMPPAPAQSDFLVPLRGRPIDYASAVGDGLDSSVLMAPIQWIARTFVEAPFAVYRLGGKGERELIDGHPLERLIEKPNGFYSGVSLWMATLVSWCLTGNAFWLVVRDGALRPIGLWFAPPWSITPRWKENEFIGWYEYRPQGMAIRLEVGDVVHLRNGINPRNVRMGLSPLAAVLRNVFTDDEASRYTAAMLHNMGVPGLVVSPDSDAAVSWDDAQAIRASIEQRTTGENRGRPIVLTGKTKVTAFGYSPKDMDVSALRNVSEERCCAALGIPAAVVGFGTGLEQTRVGATMREMVGLAWNGCIIPTQRIIASQVAHALLAEFEGNPERFAVEFNRSKVSALLEDENQRAARWDTQVKGGWAMVSEARRAFGLDVRPEHEVFLRPLNVVESGRPAIPKATPALAVVKRAAR